MISGPSSSDNNDTVERDQVALRRRAYESMPRPLFRIEIGANLSRERGWTGLTYQLYSGAYGNFSNVLVKMTAAAADELVRRDVLFSQILAQTDHVQRLLAAERDDRCLYLAFEQFDISAEQLLKNWRAKAPGYDTTQVIQGILEAVKNIHGAGVLHGDLRSKNIGITTRNGK